MESRLSQEAFSELNKRIVSLLDSFSALSILSSIDVRNLDLQTLLSKALRGLMENLDMERCSVFILHDDQLINCVGLDWNDLLEHGRTPVPVIRASELLKASIGEGIMGLAVKTGKLQHSHDCSNDPRYKVFPGHDIGSLISVPIFQLGGDVLGVLNISHSLPGFFNEWHERLLQVFCNCLGQIIVTNRLVTQMDGEIEKRTGQLRRALEEARSAERNLRESENRLNLVMEGSNDGFWDWSLISGEIRLSSRWADFLGYTPDELERLFSDGKVLVHRNDQGEVMKLIADHLQGSAPQYTAEYRMMTRAGEWKWLLDRGKVVEWDSQGRPLRITGTTSDVTNRKLAEEEKQHLENQLHHSQKMEAIGQLAGGVAHEFNNIMTAIIGYAHLLVMKTEEESQLRHFASQILTSAERAAGLTKSLLTFSRKQIANLHQVNVNDTIEKIGSLLSRLIREDVEFKTELCYEPLNILADDGQVEQVLMNLVTNARDALPHGGGVTISTGTAFLDAEFIGGFGYGTPGSYARISVQDTGLGMDESTVEKIFEPFFTTKEPGKGTGLGLAIVYGIIKQLNGYVTVDSIPGKGTDFTIYFPLISAEGQKSERVSLPLLKTGKETILIAEDDDDVRRLDRELLEECGYTVIEAANGRQALDLFLKHRDKIDMVIFDVIMPKMNGREVFEEISRIQPDIKVLFISGYTGDILNANCGIDKEFDFLSKPLPPEELLTRVREILDR
ncbi:MAG: response regulator [Geobacteraceae bacterium]|nr:response regulator [Geobacteraceae bacterium]